MLALINQTLSVCICSEKKSRNNNMISLPNNNWMFSLATDENLWWMQKRRQINAHISMLENDLIQV